MKTRYFQDRLQDLDAFEGFVPRWILPRSTINSPWNGLNATQITLLLDTAWEVKVGVAPNFPPTVLGPHDIMIQEGVAEYLSAGKDSAVYFEFNASSIVEYFNN